MTIAVSDDSGSFCSDGVATTHRHATLPRGEVENVAQESAPGCGAWYKSVTRSSEPGHVPASRLGNLLRISERKLAAPSWRSSGAVDDYCKYTWIVQKQAMS